MKAALAYELMRIATIRSTWVLSALCLSLTTLGAVGRTLSPESGRDVARGVLGDQAAYAAVLATAAGITPLLMGLLGVLAFGHEYRHGTIRTALSVLPRRTTLAAAKVLAIALWSAGIAVICIALSAVVLILLGSGRFEPGTSLTAGNTPRVALGVVAYVVLFALMGLAFGWLFRSLPAAVTLLLMLPLVVEPFLRLLLFTPALSPVADIGRYLPFGAGARLVTYNTQVDPDLPSALRTDLSPLAGGLTMAAATAALLAVAHVLFLKRDA